MFVLLLILPVFRGSGTSDKRVTPLCIRLHFIIDSFIISANKFKSGFLRQDLGKILILFPFLELCHSIKEISTILTSEKTRDSFFYLFYKSKYNDAQCKYLFDNRYGTGQSVWDGIMRMTNLVVAGKTVVVAGYGWCGKGVAMRAKGLGARVIVCEINSIKANEAWMDGFEVMPMVEAAPHGDVFITVIGNKDVIAEEHFQVMKPGAIMCNAGHFDVEINKVHLNSMSKSVQVVRPNIEEFTLHDGKRLYLLAEGRLVNLAAGDGHPAEVMDMTFALQALSLKYVAENADRLEYAVHHVPEEIDQRVAELRLESLGLKIDHLSEGQKAYLEAWHD